MKKNQIIALVGCMVCCVGVLFSLFALSPFAADIPRQTFDRNFDTRVYLRKRSEIDLKVNSFYIAGTTKNSVYLGNWTGPYHIVQVGIPGLDTVHAYLTIKDVKTPDDYRVFRLKVDSPYFYLSHGTMPGIFSGRLADGIASPSLPVQPPYFVDVVPVSPKLFALKSRVRSTQSNELATLKPDSPYFEVKPELLQKQVDGIFCVDGTLHHDKELNKMIYVYAYRNEFMVMDTCLNTVTRHHTIDTFSRAPIKVAKVASKNYSTLASPPIRVNFQSCVLGNLLLIQSPFLAKNEDKVAFQKGSPVDVYNIATGKYLYSFHLSRIKDQSPSSFAVIGKWLVAIYDHSLVMFNVNLPDDERSDEKLVHFNQTH